jgi:hypothetical protein
MKSMLGPVWIPLESVSGDRNVGVADRKRCLAYDGRVVWIWTSTRVQFMSATGLIMSPLEKLAQ